MHIYVAQHKRLRFLLSTENNLCILFAGILQSRLKCRPFLFQLQLNANMFREG